MRALRVSADLEFWNNFSKNVLFNTEHKNVQSGQQAQKYKYKYKHNKAGEGGAGFGAKIDTKAGNVHGGHRNGPPPDHMSLMARTMFHCYLGSVRSPGKTTGSQDKVRRLTRTIVRMVSKRGTQTTRTVWPCAPGWCVKQSWKRESGLSGRTDECSNTCACVYVQAHA